MLNPYVIKKYSAFLLNSFVPLITFIITQMYFNFTISVVMFLFMSLMMLLIGNRLIDNPFRSMIEGKGLLVLNIDSTGIIRPFIASLNQPYVKGKVSGNWINDIYNRKAVFNLSTPGVASASLDDKKKVLSFTLNEEQFNNSRFGMFTYPVLIYNNQIKSLITKDFLSQQEMTVFSEHLILYLNRKTEELNGYLREFGRYIVESLKPGGNNWSSWLPYIIIGGAVILLLVLFGPQIVGALQGTGGVISDTAGTITQSTAVSPLN